MTLDTSHGPITKFLKKCPKNAGKMRGKIIFSPLWCLIQKLDHFQACMQKIREKSLKTKSGAPPPHPLCGNVDIPLLIILKPSLGSREVSQKIWARSVQPF